jgi:hypothetical protein
VCSLQWHAIPVLITFGQTITSEELTKLAGDATAGMGAINFLLSAVCQLLENIHRFLTLSRRV